MTLKRGKFGRTEDEFIRRNIKRMTVQQIADHLKRTPRAVHKYCVMNGLLQQGISDENYDKELLTNKLRERPYWNEIKSQFTKEELAYFTTTWVRILKQLREDVLYTEELQIKQWITLEILSNRVMKERKRSISQIDRLQKLLDEEYAKEPELRDNAQIAGLETELSMIRNSLSSYTTEHSKILDKIKDIQRDLKAARADRIKKVEDSKSSWMGFLRALEDEERRALIGEDMEIMRMAKDKAAQDFSEFHEYADGGIDQPLLNVETAKE